MNYAQNVTQSLLSNKGVLCVQVVRIANAVCRRKMYESLQDRRMLEKDLNKALDSALISKEEYDLVHDYLSTALTSQYSVKNLMPQYRKLLEKKLEKLP